MVPLARFRINSSLPTESIQKQNSSLQECTERQNQSCDAKDNEKDNFLDAARDFMQMRVLNTVYEENEPSCGSPQLSPEIEHILSPQSTREQSAAFKQLLEFTPNLLLQKRNFQKTGKTDNVSELIREFSKSIFFPVKYPDLCGISQMEIIFCPMI